MSVVSKQEAVLGSQGGHRQNALFVTLKLELGSNFCVEVLGRDLTWTGGTSGVKRDL